MVTNDPAPTYHATLAACARATILRALLAAQGSRRDAAALLGLPERTLHYLLDPAGGYPTGTAEGRIPLFEAGELERMADEHAWPDACAKARAAQASGETVTPPSS